MLPFKTQSRSARLVGNGRKQLSPRWVGYNGWRKRERVTAQTSCAKREADRRIDVAKELVLRARDVRTSKMRKAFNDDLNALWRDLFIRLASDDDRRRCPRCPKMPVCLAANKPPRRLDRPPENSRHGDPGVSCPHAGLHLHRLRHAVSTLRGSARRVPDLHRRTAVRPSFGSVLDHAGGPTERRTATSSAASRRGL